MEQLDVAKRPPGTVKTMVAALTTTYAQALQVDIAPLLGPALKLVRERAAKLASALPPRTQTGDFGPDPKVVFDFWRDQAENSELSLADLNRKYVALAFFTTGPRPVDIHSLPLGAEKSSPPGLRGRELGTANSAQFAYFDSKTSKSNQNKARHRWSPSFTVHAIRPEMLQLAYGLSESLAVLTADRCSLLKVIAEYEHRMILALESRGLPTSILIGKRSAISARFLLFTGTDLNGHDELQFWSKQTISNTVKEFHNARYDTVCGRGKDLEPRHYRHISAGLMEAVGRSSSREARLTQLNAQYCWDTFYSILPAAPSFCERWALVSAEFQAQLNTDECFLV